MCGIVGIISNNNKDLAVTVSHMAETLRHRGPDDFGVWTDDSKGVALGHRRLSILDLSSEGHQPMVSPSGRYIISYNGEVYNFMELRKELEQNGFKFRGHSDTEVLLSCFEKWGVESAVKRFIGMFAFALWDRDSSVLYLVRDRLGIKPLYFGWSGKSFIFGSELKSFYRYPYFDAEINRDAMALYLRYNCIPSPYSIYRNIYKLAQGCILTIPLQKAGYYSDFSPYPEEEGATWKPKRYWSSHEIAREANENLFTGSENAAAEHLEKLLKDSIKMRMVADVPLGAFLSGGIDSSIMVALMQVQSSRSVKTFTIGFEEEEFNEAKHAKAVAEHLGTEHTELYITPREAMDVIPRLPQLYDEPFSDSSQIPTYLVSHLTRQHVTVSLSGDGGDELFGGYMRHFAFQALWKHIGRIPPSLRRFFASSLNLLSPDNWTQLFRTFEFLVPRRRRVSLPGNKIYKLAQVFKQNSPESMYTALVSHWREPDSIVLGAREPATIPTDHSNGSLFSNYAQWVMYLDAITYLPDDILAKVDRASMGVSLEARVPLLDHRVVEFAWRLPISMNIRNGQGKWLLRQILYKYVPQEIIERPKMGFSIPVGMWLRGPLRDWAEDLLSEKRLREEGFFNREPIRAKWTEHLNGRGDWQHDLWDVLMFQAWNNQRQQIVH